MSFTPRGVRSVSERVLKEGRALIVTDENLSPSEIAALPDGSLHVNKETGVISVKLKGESIWSPSTVVFDKVEYDSKGKIINVQNPTLVIARDTQFCEEKYIIGDIDSSSMTFTYYIDSKEDAHKRQKAYTINNGFIFELEDGDVFQNRNHLVVTVNNEKVYSVESGQVTEISNKRFALDVNLDPGDIVCARYIKWCRVGNPYPRIFLGANEPETPSIGDFWLDTNTILEVDENPTYDDAEVDDDTELSDEELTGDEKNYNKYMAFPAFKLYTENGWIIIYGDYLKYVNKAIDNALESISDFSNTISNLEKRVSSSTKEIDALKASQINRDNVIAPTFRWDSLTNTIYYQSLEQYESGSSEEFSMNLAGIGGGSFSGTANGSMRQFVFYADNAKNIFDDYTAKWSSVPDSNGFYTLTVNIGVDRHFLGAWQNNTTLINVSAKKNGDDLLIYSYGAPFSGFILTSYTGDVVTAISYNNTNNTLSWKTANSSAISSVALTPANATSSKAGISKLYSSTGQNTDGSMTQKAVTDALSNVINTSGSFGTNGILILGQFAFQWGIVYCKEKQSGGTKADLQRAFSQCYGIMVTHCRNSHQSDSEADNAAFWDSSVPGQIKLFISTNSGNYWWLAYGRI